MRQVLFLDDSSARCHWACANLGVMDLFMSVGTVPEAIGALEPCDQFKGWDEVYLDHDLGDEVFVDSSRKDCGMEVVRWIVENKPTIGKIVVHTMNTAAGHLMTRTLRLAGYDAKYQSFYRLINGLPGLEGRQIHGC